MNTALVFLHGWGGKKSSLQPLASQLEKLGYTILVLEMPGHGTTPQMNSPWNMDKFSKWAVEQIKNADIDLNNLILIGHSFGGKIILEILNQKSLNPTSVVLIDSNGVKPIYSLKLQVFKILSTLLSPIKDIKFLQPFRTLVYKYIIRENDYLNAKEMLKESFKLFNEEHYNDKLDKINIPTLIIWGSNDKVTPLWMGEVLNQKIKGSKLKVVEDTHGLPLKQPKVVANLIEEFLRNG